jgi:radical SAM protein with 4Fe4S-binding SPASM domain
MALDDIGCSDARQFVGEWMNRVFRERVPIQGSVNLTDRCNLRCIHCYIAGEAGGGVCEDPDAGRPELGTEAWKTILDQLAEAGCLFLLMTGGEPLLRPDFADLYVHARRLGMLPGVFTNATLVTDELCRIFRDYPPRYVEVSLYGATRETYECVTGVRGSFERCMRGIRLLNEGGCRLALKTIMMTLNKHEMGAMRDIAEGLGVHFRMDAGIFPRLNGDCGPVSLRVGASEAVAVEFANEKTRRSYREFFDRVKDCGPTGKLYQCGTGARTFHVDARGYLLPCMMADEVRYDLANGTFAEGWRDVIPRIRELPAPEGFVCGTCDARFLCGVCPPLARREKGRPDAVCEYWCGLGRERMRAMDDSGSTATR